MKQTIRRFALGVIEIEQEAIEEISKLYPFPELDKKKLNKQNKKMVGVLNKYFKEAYQEGVDFGKHVKSLAERD